MGEAWGSAEVEFDAEAGETPCARCEAPCWQSNDGLRQRCGACCSVLERSPDVQCEVNGKRVMVRTWSREELT